MHQYVTIITCVIFDDLDHFSVQTSTLHACSERFPGTRECTAIHTFIPLVQHGHHEFFVVWILPTSRLHIEMVVEQLIGELVTLSVGVQGYTFSNTLLVKSFPVFCVNELLPFGLCS